MESFVVAGINGGLIMNGETVCPARLACSVGDSPTGVKVSAP
jgi:hypothetical protein